MYFVAQHWKKVSNRREMFDNMAKACAFDPLVPANWYYITAERIVDPIVNDLSLSPFYPLLTPLLSSLYLILWYID